MKTIQQTHKKPSGLYTGVKVVEDFALIDKLFADKKVPLGDIEAFPNQCLVLKNGQQGALAIVKEQEIVLIPQGVGFKDFNIRPMNKEQVFASHLLSDKDIDLVTITGRAGSGKTLLAMAYAMTAMKNGDVNKVVLAKNFTPLGREVGFLKGDLGEKVRPWLGNFYDNFEVLGIPPYVVDTMTGDYPDKDRAHIFGRIELSPTTFLQGRSISDAVIIVDEVQNLSTDIVKQILSRPARGSKIILLGDLEQVFENKVSKTNNGLLSAVNAGKDSDFIGHIHMLKSERSRLAAWAGEAL